MSNKRISYLKKFKMKITIMIFIIKISEINKIKIDNKIWQKFWKNKFNWNNWIKREKKKLISNK